VVYRTWLVANADPEIGIEQMNQPKKIDNEEF